MEKRFLDEVEDNEKTQQENGDNLTEGYVAARIKQKGDSKCVSWKSLWDLILVHSDTRKRVIFPKTLGHIDEVEKVSYQVFSEDYSPLKEFVAIPRRDNISEKRWMAIVQSLQDEDVVEVIYTNNPRFDSMRVCIQSHNSVIELKASLIEIEEFKGKIEELDAALQNCELRVELLEMNNEHWKEQLQRSQGQIRGRGHIMVKALTQVQEVADHLQTLAVQVDMLSLRYESELDRGRELAWLLRKVKALNIRAILYPRNQQESTNRQEFQRSIIRQLTQLLFGGIEKGKGTVINFGDDNEDPTYTQAVL
ncbi:hypothetical protein Gotur_021039 [Gossypium turneri]